MSSNCVEAGTSLPDNLKQEMETLKLIWKETQLRKFQKVGFGGKNQTRTSRTSVNKIMTRKRGDNAKQDTRERV
jgi:starvation-inducible outer membrane lipoprotein